MNIFKNRHLFCACMSFIGCTACLLFVSAAVKLALAVLAMAIGMLVIYKYRKRLIAKNTAVPLILCITLVILSAISSFSYFDLKYKKYTSGELERVSVDAIVTSIDSSIGGSVSYGIYIRSSDTLGGGFHAILDCDHMSSLSVGDEIAGVFDTGEFEDDIGSYSEKHMRISDGIFLRLVSDSEQNYRVTASDSMHPVALLPRINAHLSDILTRDLSDDAGGLASALFLGNRGSISAQIKRDFRYAGASHVLAISGMHMSILFGVIAFILKKIGISCRVRAVALSVMAVSYLAVTGFSVSATRSVIMLLTVYLGMLLSYSSDSLTSLSLAGALILLISPNAVLDAGFWMSFAATLGILAVVPRFSQFIFDKLQPYWRRFGFILSPIVSLITLIVASVCALMPLIIVLCIFIRQISLFSVISSLVLTLPTQIILICSPLLIIFSGLPVLYPLLCICIEETGEFMLRFTSDVAAMDGVLVSLEHRATTVFALALLVTLFMFYMLHSRRPYLLVMPYICVLTVFVAVLIGASAQREDKLSVSYLNYSKQGDIIVACEGDKAVLFDMTRGAAKDLTCAAREIASLGIVDIDSIVVGDLATMHISSLSKICKSYRVRSILIPAPESSNDYFRIVSLMEVAEELGVDLTFYGSGDSLRLFEMSDVCIRRADIEDSTRHAIMLELERGEETMLYLSSCFSQCELEQKCFDEMPDVERLIIGDSGPTCKEDYTIYNGYSLEEIIFSSERALLHYSGNSLVYPDVRCIIFPDVYRFEFAN